MGNIRGDEDLSWIFFLSLGNRMQMLHCSAAYRNDNTIFFCRRDISVDIFHLSYSFHTNRAVIEIVLNARGEFG